MKSFLLAVVLLGGWTAAVAQDSDESGSADSSLRETCAAAGVDLSKPEDELSRSERRARRRCAEEAERMAASSEGDGEADDEGLICRREIVTGSHRRVRVCTTAAQRRGMRESARDVTRDVTRSTGLSGPVSQ